MNNEEKNENMKENVSWNLWRQSEFAIRGFRKILSKHSDYERLCLFYQMVMECSYG